MEEPPNTTEEIKRILATIHLEPEYQGLVYDERTGFYKGPCKMPEAPSYIPRELLDNEAIIGVREPIPKQAQHHLLLLERKKEEWKIKRNLGITEG
jgi:hypothetical protein